MIFNLFPNLKPPFRNIANIVLWISPFIIAAIGFAVKNYSLIGFGVILLTALAMIKLKVAEFISFLGTTPFLALVALLDAPIPLSWSTVLSTWACLFGIGLMSFTVGLLFATSDNTKWNQLWNIAWPIIIGLLGAAVHFAFFSLPFPAFNIFAGSIVFHTVAYINHRSISNYHLP